METSFKEEIKYINPYCEQEGFERDNESQDSGGESNLYIFHKGNKKYIGKNYRNGGFVNPSREFLLEINIKSSFSIEPIALYMKKEKEELQFYLIMEIYKNLGGFFNIINRKLDDKGKEITSDEQIKFDRYLNILLVTTSLLHVVLTLHVQKIPIIHHDLKPGNVLMSEYQYDSNEKQIKKVKIENQKHILHHIYFTNLIDFGLTKETASVTNVYFMKGTKQYRSGAYYLEPSDLLSVAIIMKILIHLFRKNIRDDVDVNAAKLKSTDNFEYRRNTKNVVEKFYYKNTKILKGLDRVINILANLYYERRSDVFGVLDILTNRKKMETIINEDFKGSEDQRSELINRYFDILGLSHITYTYDVGFIKIAPKIFGAKYDYKAFMFTLFHQKNNEFDPKFFQSYQEKIVDLYINSKNKYDLFNSIADYHFEINFFSFKKLFTNFSEDFSQTSKNTSFTINSKLFKILTSLNFRETRSLNHFSNALHLSLFSVKQEDLYNFSVCFGQDYEAKIGFLLLKSKSDFKSFINRAKYCSENREYFFDDLEDCAKIEYDDIKFEIKDFQLITSDFDNFLKIINCNKPEYSKDICIESFEKQISTKTEQNDNLLYLREHYNDDAKFLLFIHYLYFFEFKDEKLRLNSFSGDRLSKNDDEDEDEETTKKEDDKVEEDEEWKIEDEKTTKKKDDKKEEIKKFIKLEYVLFYSLKEDPKNKELFIWLTLFRLGDLIDDILSQETIEKLQNYIPVVKFLRSTGIDIFKFHLFLNSILNENKYDQFKRISHNYSLNHEINPVASKLQFLESISYFSNYFFNIIFDEISNENNSNNELLEFIKQKNIDETEINDYSDIRTKINFPYVIYPFGKIEYDNDKSFEKLKISDPTLKSKITVCVTHTLNYLTNLPFKIPIQIKLENILVDEKNGLPIIILNTFDQDNNLDFYNYENVFGCLKQVVEKFFEEENNNFLNIIKNYVKISSYEKNDQSKVMATTVSTTPKSIILFQYIFNLFLDPDSLDLTFKGTNLKKFKKFVNEVIKNKFYDNDFQKFAYELLGQSYVVKLDYLFTRMKLGSNLTKEKFVDELKEITSESSLLTLITDKETLTKLSKLFESYFIEDSYNLVHRLNQLVEEDYKKDKTNDDSDCLLKHDSSNLSEEAISYIYHINNKFVSPMKYLKNKNLYFKVSKVKYNLEDIMKRFGVHYARSFSFYYSLKSALDYLSECESDNLLPGELTIDNIYINEMDEAIVLPYKVNEKFRNETLNSIDDKLKISEHYNSIICYSYASYIPLKNKHSYLLMRIFGFDYLTELSEIFNSIKGFEDSIDDHNGAIAKAFYSGCEKLAELNKNDAGNNTSFDKYILELSSNINKLTPLFTHLLEKAKDSKIDEIKKKADERLKIYMNIKEIKEINEIEKIEKIEKISDKGGESDVNKIQYNDEKKEPVVFKQIKKNLQCFQYLQKMKNTLYLLKIEDKTNDYIINEIGFANFGMVMDLYSQDLSTYIKNNKDDLLNNPLKLFKIILRIIQIICFLHSNDLVHCDIKLSNFLLNSDGKIFLADMLHVQKESAFSKVIIGTDDYRSKNLKKFKHQDVFAFEVICSKLFGENGPFNKYIFPLFDRHCIKASMKAEDDDHHNNIDTYRQKIRSEKMYILKEGEVNDENIEKQFEKITEILFEENEISYDEKKFKEQVSKIDDNDSFENAYNNFTNIFEPNSNQIRSLKYLTEFANKLHNVKNGSCKKLEEFTNFTNFIEKIDNFIKIYIRKDINNDNKSSNFDLELEELIYERIYIHEKIDQFDEDCWLLIKYRMYEYIKKKEFDDKLLEKIKYIINILDKNKDYDAGFFYHYLLTEEIRKHLKNDIEIKKNAIRFFYDYYANAKMENTININDFEKLILEIFEFLKSDPSKIDEFKIWLIGNPENEPQDINIISIFFYFYSIYHIEYGTLDSAFDKDFYKVAEEMINKKQLNIKIQPVNTLKFLQEAIGFKTQDGQKLACIYKKYVLPPFKKV